MAEKLKCSSGPPEFTRVSVNAQGAFIQHHTVCYLSALPGPTWWPVSVQGVFIQHYTVFKVVFLAGFYYLTFHALHDSKGALPLKGEHRHLSSGCSGGNFRVNLRFHRMSVWWNLASTREFSTPYGCLGHGGHLWLMASGGAWNFPLLSLISFYLKLESGVTMEMSSSWPFSVPLLCFFSFLLVYSTGTIFSVTTWLQLTALFTSCGRSRSTKLIFTDAAFSVEYTVNVLINAQGVY